MSEITSLKDHEAAFISVRDGAEYLGLSTRTIEREILKGALPARRYGRSVRILLADFKRYVGSTGD